MINFSIKPFDVHKFLHRTNRRRVAPSTNAPLNAANIHLLVDSRWLRLDEFGMVNLWQGKIIFSDYLHIRNTEFSLFRIAIP